MHVNSAIPLCGRSASVAPDAATVAGDGVSPAASASASGSPLLGNAAATSRADWLRLWGRVGGTEDRPVNGFAQPLSNERRFRDFEGLSKA